MFACIKSLENSIVLADYGSNNTEPKTDFTLTQRCDAGFPNFHLIQADLFILCQVAF